MLQGAVRKKRQKCAKKVPPLASPRGVPKLLRIRTFETITDLTAFAACFKSPNEVFHYARRLEQEIYDALSFIEEPEVMRRRYRHRVGMLIWHLRTRPIVQRWPPDLLARLPDAVLSEGLPAVVERKRKASELAAQRERAKNTKREKGEGYGYCRKCGTILDVQHLQTRSADEGTTVYLSCEPCGDRWKV